MIKVITYGTFDFLHQGHINILKRAKELGDYLVVGVTADDFDKKRGKINVTQSLMERIEGVRTTGLADEIIVEEYEGQKIEDIKRKNIDVFTVGSDWTGCFDYLEEYCKVVYLPRTEGISSSLIRTKLQKVRLGIVGETTSFEKFIAECEKVNGVCVVGVCTDYPQYLSEKLKSLEIITSDYQKLLDEVDAIYLVSNPILHMQYIKKALESNKHVLCESPMTISKSECEQLFLLAKQRKLILAEANKTAYSTAYERLTLMLKTGVIGNVVSVDVTSTSLTNDMFAPQQDKYGEWNSITTWGAKALLPVFQILGTNYVERSIVSMVENRDTMYDKFSKIDFVYPHAVASVKVGKGVKSEGELIISGTKGYIYVPAPWWKMDYFEVRYENAEENRRYFYQLDGEGIRYQVVSFVNSIRREKKDMNISEEISIEISKTIEDYYLKKNVCYISEKKN